MIELTNAETGKRFLIDASMIVLVTDAEEGVFVWTEIEKKICFKVDNSYEDIRMLIA